PSPTRRSSDLVVVGDLLTVLGAEPLVADAPAVGPVHLAEVDVVVLRRGVQADGDVDEAEGDGPLPDGTHEVLPGVCVVTAYAGTCPSGTASLPDERSSASSAPPQGLADDVLGDRQRGRRAG